MMAALYHQHTDIKTVTISSEDRIVINMSFDDTFILREINFRTLIFLRRKVVR